MAGSFGFFGSRRWRGRWREQCTLQRNVLNQFNFISIKFISWPRQSPVSFSFLINKSIYGPWRDARLLGTGAQMSFKCAQLIYDFKTSRMATNAERSCRHDDNNPMFKYLISYAFAAPVLWNTERGDDGKDERRKAKTRQLIYRKLHYPGDGHASCERWIMKMEKNKEKKHVSVLFLFWSSPVTVRAMKHMRMSLRYDATSCRSSAIRMNLYDSLKTKKLNQRKNEACFEKMKIWL